MSVGLAKEYCVVEHPNGPFLSKKQCISPTPNKINSSIWYLVRDRSKVPAESAESKKN